MLIVIRQYFRLFDCAEILLTLWIVWIGSGDDGSRITHVRHVQVLGIGQHTDAGGPTESDIDATVPQLVVGQLETLVERLLHIVKVGVVLYVVSI